MKPKTLTEKQQKVYDFIVEQQAIFGFPPTVNEIQTFMGYASPYAVTIKLHALEKKGWVLLRGFTARGIQILAKYPLQEGSSHG